VVDAEALFVRVTDEAGLNEQEAPTISIRLQESATVLEKLLKGVTVNVVVPVCPAVIVRFGELAARLKSGMFTFTNTLEFVDSKFASPE
jgi:hypothetical protein